jgi:hypothetical protein
LYLSLPSLELIEQSFRLWPDVELGVIVDEQDEVSVVDEPLASVVERVLTVDFASATGFQNARNFSKNCLNKEKTFIC